MSQQIRIREAGAKAQVLKMVVKKIIELETQGNYEEIASMMDRIVIL